MGTGPPIGTTASRDLLLVEEVGMTDTRTIDDLGATLDERRRQSLWAALGRRAADIAREVTDRAGPEVVASAARDPDHPLCWVLEDRNLVPTVPAPTLARLERKWGLATATATRRGRG
jgi:hypothetical protein